MNLKFVFLLPISLICNSSDVVSITIPMLIKLNMQIYTSFNLRCLLNLLQIYNFGLIAISKKPGTSLNELFLYFELSEFSDFMEDRKIKTLDDYINGLKELTKTAFFFQNYVTFADDIKEEDKASILRDYRNFVNIGTFSSILSAFGSVLENTDVFHYFKYGYNDTKDNYVYDLIMPLVGMIYTYIEKYDVNIDIERPKIDYNQLGVIPTASINFSAAQKELKNVLIQVYYKIYKKDPHFSKVLEKIFYYYMEEINTVSAQYYDFI